MIIRGRVRNVPGSLQGVDNTPELYLGRMGEQVTTALHGKYFSLLSNGFIFYTSTSSAGVAIPADNATSPTFAIWNPTGSGKMLVPITLRLGIVTLGTRVVSAIGLNLIKEAGSNIATGHAITAWTAGTINNALVGSGNISVMKYATAATVTAQTNFIWSGLYHDLAAGGSPPPFVWDFDGMLALQPGNAAFVVSADAATGSTYVHTLFWAEVPIT